MFSSINIVYTFTREKILIATVHVSAAISMFCAVGLHRTGAHA